jgi:putative ABC transport system permease protein
VRDVLGRVREVIGNASLAITVVGAVTLVTGVMILVGAVAMTRFQRLYETAIYRALGASARLIVTVAAIEYGLLGLLAGTLGGLGAVALSWGLARFLFDIEWRLAPGLLIVGVSGTAMAVCLVGIVASADLLLRPPLTILRDP